jgi:hypothetical protein
VRAVVFDGLGLDYPAVRVLLEVLAQLGQTGEPDAFAATLREVLVG